MPKSLTRLIAFLLVPCLIPELSFPLATNLIGSDRTNPVNGFLEQVIVPSSFICRATDPRESVRLAEAGATVSRLWQRSEQEFPLWLLGHTIVGFARNAARQAGDVFNRADEWMVVHEDTLTHVALIGAAAIIIISPQWGLSVLITIAMTKIVDTPPTHPWFLQWIPLKDYCRTLGLNQVPPPLVPFLSSRTDPAAQGRLADIASALPTDSLNSAMLDFENSQMLNFMPQYSDFVDSLLRDPDLRDAVFVFLGRGGDVLFETAEAIASFDPHLAGLQKRLVLLDYSKSKFLAKNKAEANLIWSKIAPSGPKPHHIVLVEEYNRGGAETLHSLDNFLKAIAKDTKITMRYMGSGLSADAHNRGPGTARYEASHWAGWRYESYRAYTIVENTGKLEYRYRSTAGEHGSLQRVEFYSKVIKWIDGKETTVATFSGPKFYAAIKLLQKACVAAWVYQFLSDSNRIAPAGSPRRPDLPMKSGSRGRRKQDTAA